MQSYATQYAGDLLALSVLFLLLVRVALHRQKEPPDGLTLAIDVDIGVERS